MNDKETRDLRDLLNGETDRAIALAGRVVEAERQLAEARAGQAAAEAREGWLRRVLAKIEEGKGSFSRDPLEHCSNAVEDMRVLATAALATPSPPASELLAAVQGVERARAAYEAFPVNALDRPESWRRLHNLLRAAAELRRAIGLPAKEQ